ncbi:MAB_1171c family putative transporter [Streptomyces iconiensis]|uniref:DUF6545 domain-containing protein n=1 Tax=Streptomyces iconiensis TaxID=1384038 RepID=A0ABT7A4L7_9ACTN|nr:MAB_1171c family putative transporter [Streptomyces iconiensis]MDJ1136270.1 hypothetical protein [Streptomyces iconiensis]
MSLAAGWRVVQAARHPRDVPLRAVAVCMVCIWGIYATAVPGDAGTLAALAGDSAPDHRVAKVVQHVLVATCGYALLCFYLYAAPTSRARRRAVREGLALCLVVAALAGFAAWAPSGSLTHGYSDTDMGIPPVLGFYGVTAVYLGYLMGATCWWTTRHAGISRQPHAAGMWVAAWGLGASAVACAAHVAAMVAHALGGTTVFWVPCAQLLLVAAVVTFVAGFSYPAVRLRAAGLSLWFRRVRTYRRLEPLWLLLTSTYPDLVFAPQPRVRSRGSVHRRLHRRMIECRDGLVRVSPHLGLAPSSSVLLDLPPDILAERLRTACASPPVRGTTDCPPLNFAAWGGQGREGDLRQLLELSDALRSRSPRQDQPQPAPGSCVPVRRD